MPVEVAMCRVGNKVIRHLIAASVEELNALYGLHAGLPAYVTGTGAFQWDGEAWVAGGGGSVGPQGPAGAAGATGATGPQGAQGETGATGPQGPAGADGSDGAAGVAGAQGPQGNTGDQGIQGVQGIQGPAGNNGSNGAAGLGFGAIVKLSADLAAVTTTALADATGLSFALASGRFYSFTFWIRFSTAATTTGAQFAVNAPANSYLVYRTETSLTAAAAGAPTFRTARAVNIGTASASVDAANGNLLAIVQGMIQPSANGTLIVRVGTEVAASGVTVRAGSCGVLYDFGT